MDARIEALRKECYRLSISVSFSTLLPAGRRGEWHAKTRQIIIKAGMSTVQTVCALQHELIHAQWGHEGAQPASIEARVDEEVACRLISPAEYALAERLYGGSRLLLARELDVTPAIIDAYQRVLTKAVERALA